MEPLGSGDEGPFGLDINGGVVTIHCTPSPPQIQHPPPKNTLLLPAMNSGRHIKDLREGALYFGEFKFWGIGLGILESLAGDQEIPWCCQGNAGCGFDPAFPTKSVSFACLPTGSSHSLSQGFQRQTIYYDYDYENIFQKK